MQIPILQTNSDITTYFLRKVDQFFKVFIEFVTILHLFYVCLVFLFVCLFDCKACEILASRPAIELTPPALEGEILTLDLQGCLRFHHL